MGLIFGAFKWSTHSTSLSGGCHSITICYRSFALCGGPRAHLQLHQYCFVFYSVIWYYVSNLDSFGSVNIAYIAAYKEADKKANSCYLLLANLAAWQEITARNVNDAKNIAHSFLSFLSISSMKGTKLTIRGSATLPGGFNFSLNKPVGLLKWMSTP